MRYFDANISPISRNYCHDENRENRRRTGDSNCMPKVAPLKVVILPILVKMAKKRQRAGNSNWMQKVAKKEKMAIWAKMRNLAQGLVIFGMWQIS